MISEKMTGYVKNSSAIRAMFEEGKRLGDLYGAENAVSYTHLDVYKRQELPVLKYFSHCSGAGVQVLPHSHGAGGCQNKNYN